MEANYIDLPTILIWSFWLGFALLILYLRREDKREGYPLDSDRQGVSVQGFPAMPEPREARVKHPALVSNPDAGAPAAAHVVSDTVTTRVVETGRETIVMEREVIRTDDETVVIDRVEVTEHEHEDDDKEGV